ncbi:mitochondrial antiviral-signaling protein isoform X2 [Hyaena hyaena]|uniref:mitochondrial antiviral-signaling protein isoform X2 n=3 Tax=Hyaena hyaena TaxID=95912 RepID=UPI001923BD50|nr:mitochondrial antiviral-signaling protein isoform X2 [Hyaena hyaena]
MTPAQNSLPPPQAWSHPGIRAKAGRPRPSCPKIISFWDALRASEAVGLSPSQSVLFWARALCHFRTWTAMTFAEDETFKYIRKHYSNFGRIHVPEILPYLSCLTISDQDRLRAHCQLWGNQGTLWELFDSLRRRTGWVESFIKALRICELTALANEVASVYQSNLLGVPKNHPAASLEPQLAPAQVPGPPIPAVAPSAPHNGYREEEPSFPMPVQETQPPESLGESSKKVPQTPSSGAVLRRPAGPPEPSSDMAALSPLTSIGHQEEDAEPGRARTAGVASSPTSPYGPVSPTVSFQPLSRSIPRASRLPVSAPPTGTSLSSPGLASAGGAGDHGEATICTGAGVSTSSLTTSTAPSKVPANSACDRTMPSKLPTSSKPSGTMSTNVLTSLPPSKLPINSTRAGTVAPNVPTGLVPDHRMSTSTAPTKVAANTVSPVESSISAEETPPVAPEPTGTSTGDSLPGPDHSSATWGCESELSKPGRLVSHIDSEPFSGCSADLALSCSKSLGTGPDNAPEENEYQSMDSIRIQVAQDPSVDLMEGGLRPPAAPQPPGREEVVPVGSIAPLLGAAAAGVLLATLFAVLYRRRV